MLRSLYTAYTGMSNEQKRLDILSNNLANVTTAGYKQENTVSQSFDKVLGIKIRDASEAFNDHAIGHMSLGVKLGELYRDYSQGALRKTSGTYDLAIAGDGFFAVRTVNRNGEESEKYTRDGNFRITNDGHVTDSEGNQLKTEGGVLEIPLDATDVAIKRDGSVYADGELVDKIKVVDFEDYDYLEKYGDNLFRAVDGATEKGAVAEIHQGYIEQSNVNSVREMVEMITIERSYQAGSKAIQTADSMMDKVINSAGSVSG
jgi:flagellar basal-body rod protein FlgG